MVEDLLSSKGLFRFASTRSSSPDVLGQSPFLIDYGAHTIRFGTPARLPISLPLQSDGTLATVEVEINHAPVRLQLDTGASCPSILFETARFEPPTAAVMPVSSVKVNHRETPRQHRRVRSQTGLLHSLSLGGTDFGRESGYVTHNRRQPGLDFDGLINPVNLGITRLAIDVQQARPRLQP